MREYSCDISTHDHCNTTLPAGHLCGVRDGGAALARAMLCQWTRASLRPTACAYTGYIMIARRRHTQVFSFLHHVLLYDSVMCHYMYWSGGHGRSLLGIGRT